VAVPYGGGFHDANYCKINHIIHLKSGSANCYQIQADEGQFILKEFQSKYSVDDIKMEPVVTEFVRERGIPATRFVPTITGEYIWELRGHAFHLQEFVEGIIFPNNNS
jgi:Ser/Thr protein kinase RdoA (MazF antagonist)